METYLADPVKDSFTILLPSELGLHFDVGVIDDGEEHVLEVVHISFPINSLI